MYGLAVKWARQADQIMKKMVGGREGRMGQLIDETGGINARSDDSSALLDRV